MSLQNKIIVITGGASGIGRGMALMFAKEGANVIIADIDVRGGYDTVAIIHQTVKDLKGDKVAVFIQCDVTKREDIQRAITEAHSQFGRPLDIMVNNAGIALPPGTDLRNGDLWKKVVMTNLVGVIDGTQLAIAEMEAGGRGGVILNMASTAGIYPVPSLPVYSASKAGVVQFTRSLKHLEKEIGIRVVALCPNFTYTPILSKFGKDVVEGLTRDFGMLEADDVIYAALELIHDTDRMGSGAILRIMPGLKDYWMADKRQRKANL